MNKTSIIISVIGLIPLIIFNLIFFLVGGIEHVLSVWISYGFMHFAYIMLLLTSFCVSKGRSAPVFSYSLHVISSVYLIIEFIFGLIFIFFAFEEITLPLLIQSVLAGIYVVIFLSHVAANEKTSSAELHKAAEIEFIKSTAAELKSLIGTTNNPEIQTKVESLYDSISSSPSKSNPNVYSLEQEIISEINRLEIAVSSSDVEGVKSLVPSIQKKISERNRMLRLLQ